MKFFRRIWKSYVTDVRDSVDAASAETLAMDRKRADRTMLVCVFTLLAVLFLLRFYGNARSAKRVISLLGWLGLDGWAHDLKHALYQSPNRRFNQRLFWAIARVIGYFGISIAVIKLVLKARLRDMGMGVAGLRKSCKAYLLLAVLITPVFVIASYGHAFQAKYPYYKLSRGESLWPWFVAWECLYAIQFVGLEFFYRGFLVHGLKHRFGYAAVWVMVIPYLTIHFGKPPAEAFGAIFAGFILGTLSLKSRTIWWGAALHIWVACSMDLLSLWHAGRL